MILHIAKVLQCVYTPLDTDKKEENEKRCIASYPYIISARPKEGSEK